MGVNVSTLSLQKQNLNYLSTKHKGKLLFHVKKVIVKTSKLYIRKMYGCICRLSRQLEIIVNTSLHPCISIGQYNKTDIQFLKCIQGKRNRRPVLCCYCDTSTDTPIPTCPWIRSRRNIWIIYYHLNFCHLFLNSGVGWGEGAGRSFVLGSKSNRDDSFVPKCFHHRDTH